MVTEFVGAEFKTIVYESLVTPSKTSVDPPDSTIVAPTKEVEIATVVGTGELELGSGKEKFNLGFLLKLQ